jgi:hypothetical protein
VITFINSVSLGEVHGYVASVSGISLVSLVCERVVAKKDLDSWLTLQQLGGVDIFGTETASDSIYDYGDLALSVEVLEYLAGLEIGGNVYLYRSTKSLLAEDKKMIEKAGLKYAGQPKISSDSRLDFAHNYVAFRGYQTSHNEQKVIAKNTGDYSEVVDCIDLLELCDDRVLGLEQFVKEETVPLFMLGFNPEKLNVTPWVREISDDQNQLIMSLIFGKLQKQNNDRSRLLQSRLIELDVQTKSHKKLNASQLLKLFLWQAKNQQY